MDCLLEPLLGRGGARERQKTLRGCVILRERIEELLAGLSGLEKQCGRRLFMGVSAIHWFSFLWSPYRGQGENKLDTGKQFLEPRHHILDALLKLDQALVGAHVRWTARDVGSEVALGEDGGFAFLANAHIQGHFIETFLGEGGCGCFFILRQFITILRENPRIHTR